MKSIRRALILTLVSVLVLALALVGLLVYSMTKRTLAAKLETSRQLIESQYQEEFDGKLLEQSRTLADLVRAQVKEDRLRQLALTPLGYLTAAPSPMGHITSSVWLLQGLRGQYSFHLHASLVGEIAINEDDLVREHDTRNFEYSQVNTEWGAAWTSRTLGDYTIPLNNAILSSGPRFDWRFDDVTIGGVRGRRVVLKVPLTRWQFLFTRRPPSPRLGGRFGPDYEPPLAAVVGGAAVVSSRPNFPERPPRAAPKSESANIPYRQPPPIFITCVWDLDGEHPVIKELQASRDRRLAELVADKKGELYDMRLRLIWTALLALVLFCSVGWLMIGLGLKPLRTLSESVSRISPKDFRLQVDARELPREVLPVVDRLEQTLAELRRAFDREKQATADISHELRTPIAALLTTLEVSLRKPRSNEDYLETLRDTHAIGKQLNRLVERILTLAWLDAGEVKVHLACVDVRELLESCAAISRPLAEARGLNFRLDLPKPFHIETDPDKLREVLINLLHNAIEYNRPGGDVTLAAQRAARGGLVVTVADTGIGITLDDQQRIFERFYRADPSRNETGVHAGLGLSIVKEYVERLGGTLTLDSGVGRGSRFRIELPESI